MNILVDTSIWSLALRKNTSAGNAARENLAELINESRAKIIGPIRQELLSGIRLEKQFKELRLHLAAFPDLPTKTSDYEKAAEFFNICRKNGIQGSNTDFLICSVAHRCDLEIYTSDKDFLDYMKLLPIKLYLTP
jgi:hypothetical protein